MLLWTTRSRALTLSLFALVVTVVFAAPIVTVIAAALAGSWTGPLPSNLGGRNFAAALSDENLASLTVSLQTAFVAGALALAVGTWAALAAREAPTWLRRTTDAVFHLPIAIPSVAIGLGLLITFNSRPLLLPALGAAAGLSIALSMGELGATVMVYPATWKTLPVSIFGLTDRGQVFLAAADTTLLLAVTLLALLVVGRLRRR